jgi:hypothetical protein
VNTHYILLFFRTSTIPLTTSSFTITFPFWFYIYIFWWYWTLNSGQVLYRLTTPLAFVSVCFWDRVLFFAHNILYQDPPILGFPSSLGWQACTTMPSFFLLKWKSPELFFFWLRLAWNHNSTDLGLPSS